MRTRTKPKVIRAQTVAASPVSPATNPGEILLALKPLAMPPAEAVKALFPKIERSQEALEMLAGLFSGLNIDLGVTVPPWAKEASRRCFESFGFDFLLKLLQAGDVNERDMGKLIGLWESELKRDFKASQLIDALDALCRLAKSAANEAPAEAARDFHAGRVDARKISNRMETPSQRAKVFAIIAACWRGVEKMQSAGELHRWLLENHCIVPSTDPAETRTVCRLIGFKPPAKPGRPSSRK